MSQISWKQWERMLKKMCGRFYIDDETAREIEKIARKIDVKMAKTGMYILRSLRSY